MTTFRAATARDLDQIQWALYAALAWNPERELPPLEFTLEHPEVARYHRDWGRAGDLGVIAADGDELVGVAYCRLFTDEDHGHGFVDERTPEVAVAVRDDRRGQGLGGELLTRLADAARAGGFEQLSLSVDPDNRARRLYERLGYRTLTDEDDGVRMLLTL